jgi:T5SS/PEP-CTERM-associated repeat protein
MRASLAVAAFVGVAGISSARAATVSWNKTTGGGFSDGTNWSNPISPNTPPGTGDAAYFLKDATFQVTFTQNVTNQQTYNAYGVVTFDLGGNTWNLTSTGTNVTVNQGTRNVIGGHTTSGDSTISGDRLTVGLSHADGRSAALSVSGSGTKMTFTGLVYIGLGDDATLSLSDGAALTTAASYMAASASYSSTATVTGGSTWTTTELDVGGVATPGGTATLNINNGQASASASNITIYHAGTVSLEGKATVTIGNSSKALDVKGGKLNVSHLNNTITGNLTLESATDGGTTYNPVTAFTLGDVEDYGQLNVSGTAALAGTLNVSLGSGFSLSTGQTLTILTATGGLNGTTFATTNLPTGLAVSYTATSVVLTAVPEPATLGLLGMGGLLALRRRRR